ncbi:hypothetical protein ABEB36_008981 [Hypothenemus hampei]|uniref:Ubiquitin-like modifier-activating enzyme ATG7 n=1 Tax=Hypothenemus hampei TaxID=57062 RepID=A0ABD1EP92_HYPHA
MESSKLTYVQLSSLVNPSFWNKLTELKLDVDKLSETERHLWGYFPLLSNNDLEPYLEVDSTSFNECFNGQNMYIPFTGKILNKNTIEQFKETDKMQMIQTEGSDIFQKIISEEVLRKPAILNRFFILSFADLKKYHYYYWFAFPVPLNVKIELIDRTCISEYYKLEIIENLYTNFKSLDAEQKPYFIFDESQSKILPLDEIKHFQNYKALSSIFFVFYNISNNSAFIGSQLRNFVILITHFCPFLQNKTQNFIALQYSRDGCQVNINKSVIYKLKLPYINTQSLETWVGWEKNERQKLGPRKANMKNSLDPQGLAENAVNLNLKLMKWRVVPNIDLEILRRTKCLLLGSGTLGCSVARCLLGWGIHNITLIDNSTVSFSNPVRQSLFTYEDSVKIRAKSEAAADRLKEIFPGVKSKGIQLNIPMPSHTIGEALLNQTIKTVETLTDLIKEADVIFLLMDSRESRWLPTLLGSFYNKIVINAALGFDSYLVMRHGTKGNDKSEQPKESIVDGFKVIEGNNLGCYFCNDITAPGDSIKNRTLDQQCTVTRPGVSQIAGALAVELMVSILQHKNGVNAPAFYRITVSPEQLGPETENQCLLGLVPHSIRGFLSSFSNILPATMKYDRCVACSNFVLLEYASNGIEFLLKVFNSSKHLEEVTKLNELFQGIEFDEVLDLSDEISD